jgi:hypothetical protein
MSVEYELKYNTYAFGKEIDIELAFLVNASSKGNCTTSLQTKPNPKHKKQQTTQPPRSRSAKQKTTTTTKQKTIQRRASNTTITKTHVTRG